MFSKLFADNFIYYKPCNIVSGDFYYLKETAQGGSNCVVLAVADCTGHGVPGGFLSVLGMALLNDIISSGNFSSAANILDQMRVKLKTALNQTGKQWEQQDGIEMALIVYFPEQGKIEFSGARNGLYIIDDKNILKVFKGDNMPVGIHLREDGFTNTEIILKGGEVCYMFTDGITDQMNEYGGKLMRNRLKNWLSEINKNNCIEQQQAINEKMQHWMKKSNGKRVDQIDDMLLMGIKI
jgi:serine phosphatase RsbU (regulator of sigma subunit)